MKIIQTGHGTTVEAEAKAAVSIIRCRRPDDSVLLLRRKKKEGDPWSGHFAFPGGRREPDDDSLFETCIRETYEETRIALAVETFEKEVEATYAGSCLSASILVQPFLFSLTEKPEIEVERSEIQSYHWLDITSFQNPEAHVEVEMIPSRVYTVFPLQDYYIWGFTYNLLCRIFQFKP